MIQGMGVDITAVARVERLLRRRPPALARLFSPGEVADAGEGRQRGPRLASRFAAKEALIKAAGGLRGGLYRDIEVRRRPGQGPMLLVHGPLGEWLSSRGLQVHLSLSHEDAYAVATVLLIRGDGYAHGEWDLDC